MKDLEGPRGSNDSNRTKSKDGLDDFDGIGEPKNLNLIWVLQDLNPQPCKYQINAKPSSQFMFHAN